MISDDFQIGPNGAYEHVGNELDMQYQDLLQHILDNGVEKKDRTGTGTLSVFGYQIRHNMKDGFPLLTTKKMAWKTMVTELLWFLRGDTDIRYLWENDCHIWDGDWYKNYCKQTSTPYSLKEMIKFGIEWKNNPRFFNKSIWDLGPIYGKQWRKWNCLNEGFVNLKEGEEIEVDLNCINISHQVDQIANLISELKTNPDSRRLMVNAWNVGELDQMVLPPCHYGFQCYVREGKYLSLMWNQRSVDTFLGLPFNIASYGLLLEIIAKEVNMIPDELIGNLGDVHLYSNHIEQAKEQISRTPYDLPKLGMDYREGEYDKNLKDFVPDDFYLIDYQSHPTIKAPLSN
jgi:thymidylate synthase